MTATARRFMQVDVFAAPPPAAPPAPPPAAAARLSQVGAAEGSVATSGRPSLTGNPLAVVLDAQGLDDAAMQRFARWTNLSETAFVLPPTDPVADYRARIFTPDRELPFAGHPTLGACHAWLAAGGQPRGDVVVQQCGLGRVPVRRADAAGVPRLAFAAPPLRRTGPLDAAKLAHIVRVLRIEPQAVLRHQWVCNGPSWAAVMLASAEAVLALQPDLAAIGELEIGVVGPHPPGSPCRLELRAFLNTPGVQEDPVTGSLNAGVAQWLIGAGLAPPRYVASQGTALGRAGRVHVEQAGARVWIGGDCQVCIDGRVAV